MDNCNQNCTNNKNKTQNANAIKSKSPQKTANNDNKRNHSSSSNSEPSSPKLLQHSTVDHLKVQTSNPEAYRTLVHYLRNEKAEFHTFQLKEDKPMRIVIRNLHPSTSTEMIKNELEHRLYEVRQVTQVISKIPLPLFFVDLEPTDHSKEIFKLESILHTKIKIEEPHKPKIISQCQNCQAYGHTKAYCGYSPRCVRCGDDHSSSACPNSRQDPMRCAFCTGNHPANYRGCTVYKNLQPNHPRNTTSCNPPSGHSQTYAQATQGQHLQSDIPPPTPDINSLMSSFAFQNITLRKITNAPPFVTNMTLHKDLGIKTVEEEAAIFYKQFYNKLEDHENPLIKGLHIPTLPAKSSLSPSHIKNTKNNLTIHPIKIVKSNDNTNNWQTVPIRSPSTPTSPNPIIQKTNSFSSKNRFSALATNEISYEISNEVEMLSQEISNVQPKIPPIYIKDDIDFFDFCKKIKPFTDPDGFNTKSSSSGLKLMTYSINAYRQIIKFLEINNMNFHTYQTNEEKAFRVVIRHLHHTTPTDYIKEELHSLGFITRSITNCLQYKTKNPLPLFFVDLEPSPSNHNIYKVDSICYTKIKIEAPHPKKNPVQRLRCQNYGHTRTYCHHTPRCVKRCDIHLSFECQKDSNTPATCALCSGDHPASYKGCPKFKLLQKGRSSIKTNRPTET
ncbi:hypothetical protein QTP88_000051 [Uroleucon formosanum]